MSNELKSNLTGLPENQLLLGVDGGGSKTAAVIASLDSNGNIHVLGRGRSGPSTLNRQGIDQVLANLDQAIDQALLESGIQGRKVDCAVLALAGSGHSELTNLVSDWAASRQLCKQLNIMHDAAPVLASGPQKGPGNAVGVALIVGTGSVAIGVNEAGESVTIGGWSHWIGDKGSGYYLGRMALSAIAEAEDGIGPETLLTGLVLDHLQVTIPRNMLQKLSASDNIRSEVAALAPIVLEAVKLQDVVAIEIVNKAVSEVTNLVTAVVRQLKFKGTYPLMLAGGVVCRSQVFQGKLIRQLNQLQPVPKPVCVVDEPVNGCLQIAKQKLTKRI